jgi:hypothetical protein
MDGISRMIIHSYSSEDTSTSKYLSTSCRVSPKKN